MGRNQVLRFAWIIGVFCLSACRQAEPPSPIVQKLEAAGSGDLSKTSADSIQQWLGPRRQLAIEVETLCKQVRPRRLQTGQRPPKAVFAQHPHNSRFTGTRRDRATAKPTKAATNSS